MYISLLPVDSTDGIVLGYSFSIGLPFDSEVLNIRNALNSSYGLTSRLAFDGLRRHFFMYLPSLAVGSDLIVAIDWINETVRGVICASIPSRQYGAGNMPSLAISITEYEEHYVQTSRQDSESQSSCSNSSLATIRNNEEIIPREGVLNDTEMTTGAALVLNDLRQIEPRAEENFLFNGDEVEFDPCSIRLDEDLL